MINPLKYAAPIYCALNITGRCNLKCLHCSASSEPTYSKDMTTSQLESVIDTLARAGIFKVNISGGEPLVREDFFKITSMLKERRIPFTLFTNATLVSREVTQRLVAETNILDINTSLDGSNSSTHDALRGRGAFKLATKGITFLTKAGISVHATCTVSKLNAHELPQIARIAQDLGIRISFDPVTLVGRAQKKPELFTFTKPEKSNIYDIVASLTKEFDHVNGGVVLEWPIGVAEIMKHVKFQTKPGANLVFCGICKESVAITPDGWVVPCNNFWDYKMGNVLEQDILEIYHSQKAQCIRNLSTLTSDQLDGCSDCIYTEFCSGGCRAIVYALTNSLTGIDETRCLRHYLKDETCESISACDKL